jgi:hypothetical protein
MQVLTVSYGVWKQVADANPTWPRYHVAKNDGLVIVTGHSDTQFVSDAMAGADKTEYETEYDDSVAVSLKEDAIALLVGLSTKPIPRSSRGHTVVQSDLREGSKTQVISQDFCDKTTWYATSIARTNQAMTDMGAGTVWQLTGGDKFGVDVCHGRLLHERDLRPTYAAVVKVDGVTKTEKDPHDDVGDYTIDYRTMRVTFDVSQAGNTVTLDFHEVQNSKWYVAPEAGKILRLGSAELNFARGARMKDTFVFALRVGGQAVNTRYYQTVKDLVIEANRSYPIINKTLVGEGPALGWRDLQEDVDVYAWDYSQQATIDLRSSWGMDIEISLEHDVECDGDGAIVTFYCTSEDEG